MKNDLISSRVGEENKLAFTSVCEDVGLSPSQAIKLFAKAVINYGGIPFEIKANQPNAVTVAAIAELESGQANSVKNIEELFDDLGVGELNNA